jgi:stage V sporulation protein AA
VLAENRIDIYVRPRQRLSVPRHALLTVGKIAEVAAVGAGQDALLEIPVHRLTDQDGTMCIIPAIDVIVALKRRLPEAEIHLIGPSETIVDIRDIRESRPSALAVILVWLLLFTGSALTIMNFHADVSMLRVQQNIYYLMTGAYSLHPYVLQIPYAFGVGVGMALFFNHLLRRKVNEEEPSPLEVEMFMYEQSINDYVITQENSKKHEGRV